MKIDDPIVVLCITIIMAFTFVGLVVIPYEQTQNQNQEKIVPCSNYYQVKDLYKTPGPEYHIIISTLGNREITFDLSGMVGIEKLYPTLKIGGYVTQSWIPFKIPVYQAVNLTFLSENESGMRNACRVD
jgi:hypothetical protein